MPVTGYPYSLEIILEQLNAKGTLSSWQIFEEKSGSVCVRLRYDCNGDSQSTMDRSKITYKRKTQKQSDRDYQRAQRYNTEGMKTRSKTRTESNVEMPRCDFNNLHSETIDLDMSNICDTPVQVEHNTSVNHDSPVMSLIVDPDSSLPNIDINKPMCDDQETDQGVTPPPASKEAPFDSSTKTLMYGRYDQPSDRCTICGLQPGMCWRRCTHIDHESTFTICNRCFHVDQVHREHLDQINMYRPPNNPQHSCSSCGCEFDSKISEVSKCKKCHDFLLCNDCFRNSKHKGHTFFMEKTLVGGL